MNARFGNESLQDINEEIIKSIPINTVRSKNSVWTQFQKFCGERSYDVSTKALSVEMLGEILLDWGYNMRKADGSHYKELVVKLMWNSVAKQIQELYYNTFNITIEPFTDIAFKAARAARDSLRRKLQLEPKFRKTSATALTNSEIQKMIDVYDENTPEGLLKKFYHIAAHELAWRGGEATSCLVNHFREEFDNQGVLTGRIEYNPIISKTAQGGSKKLTDSKWLVTNKINESLCPVRLFRTLLLKRGRNITTDRLFLTPNPNWKCENINTSWYKNSPVGKNTISKWTKMAAEAIGIDTKRVNISNHSHRASTISHLAKAGVPEQSLIKITGHSKTGSLKPYLQFDEEHHNQIVQQIRTNSVVLSTNQTDNPNEIIHEQIRTESVVVNNATAKSNDIINVKKPNVYNNCTFNFPNCSNVQM